MVKQKTNQEERLRTLLEAGQEPNRFKWAKAWKEQGKKVIGLLDSYIPEEVIYAAGAMPWHIMGTWRQNVGMASIYRPPNTCRYCAHVLESLLAGELDFLDGVIGSDWDDDRRRLFDQWTHLQKSDYRYILHVPVVDSELTRHNFTEKVEELRASLEKFLGVRITESSLNQAIEKYNHMRSLLMKVYELKKKERPPLTGAETLGLTTAAMIMPKDEYIKEVEALLPYLETREAPAKTFRPRLLVSSERLDNPAYITTIEEAGALVAMDDLDTGSRYFWRQIETNREPVAAIAQRYLLRPPCPRMLFWDRQVKQVIEWAREWKIDGVINFAQRYSYPRLFGIPYFRDQMAEAGIPFITIDRAYHLENVGQIQTRAEAFVETIVELT